jgi:hypothetical protein
MVDLAIAANFARELTEEQFAERGRKARGRTPAGARNGAGPAAARGAPRTGSEAAARATPRHADTPGRRGDRLAGSRLGRTLSRLAQVRG